MVSSQCKLIIHNGERPMIEHLERAVKNNEYWRFCRKDDICEEYILSGLIETSGPDCEWESTNSRLHR